MDRPPRVFISYSHDHAAHAQRVLQLGDRLRSDGIDARLDRYEHNPPQGWPRWMVEQVQEADFIVCVCTAVYRERFEGRVSEGRGRGVNWEGFLATQLLYDADARSSALVPVLLDASGDDPIPTVLRPFTPYRVHTDYLALRDRLLGRDRVPTPELGSPPPAQPTLADQRGKAPGRPPELDAWRLLEGLLLDLYSVDQARGWARYLDRDLERWLPGDGVAPGRFFGDLARELQQRNLVCRAFFHDRVAERPERRARIEGVRELFVGAGLLEAEVAPPPPLPTPPPAPTLLWDLPPADETRRPSVAALPQTHLHLDRIHQWRDLRSRLCRRRPQAFLFHAPSDQALHWFAARVTRFVNDEDHLHGMPPGAEVRVVSTASVQGGLGARCDTPAAWVNRIARTIARGGGTLTEVLQDQTTSAPLLLVLGPNPFRDGPGGTPPAVFEAFLGALTGIYARTLTEARLAHPVHLLVPIHGPDEGDFVSGARQVFVQGQELGVWGFAEDVARVHYPSLAEVREYVTEYLGLVVPDPEWWPRLEAAHTHSHPHYDQLSAALDALLAEVWPAP